MKNGRCALPWTARLLRVLALWCCCSLGWASGLPELLHYDLAGKAESAVASEADAGPGRHFVRLDLERLPAYAIGQKFGITLPRAGTLAVALDRVARHASGSVTWVGHLDGLGTDYRVLITAGKEGSLHGNILTPAGEFRLEGANGRQILIDVRGAGLRTPPLPKDDGRVPPVQLKPSPGAASAAQPPAEQAAAAASQSVIDLVVFYTPELVARYGSDAGARARIDHLVAIANQAYVDSGVAITLHLVNSVLAAYPAANNLSSALQALAASENSAYGFPVDPSLANVVAYRSAYGADLVTLVRPFSTAADPTTCGLGYLGGGGLNNIANYANWGYSVVNDGTDVNGQHYYCHETTLAHELGHNMGSAHDPEHATSPGAYPYSYGHGQDNLFGTIMSYISPNVYKFSNPSLLCVGQSCGITDQRDNARSLNNTRAAVSAFRPTRVPLDDQTVITPETGWWANPAEASGGRGFFIEKRGSNLFMGVYTYGEDGLARWHVAGGAMSGNIFQAPLQYLCCGQTLSGGITGAQFLASPGDINIRFTGTRSAVVTLPGGGQIDIQRFNIVAGGVDAPKGGSQPESGFWIGTGEQYRGFSLEIQNGQMFLVGYMYDVPGNAVWYGSLGAMSSATLYQGSWAQYGNGQTLTGPVKSAGIVNGNLGKVTVQFSDGQNAKLTMPGGYSVNFKRFVF